MFHHYLKAQLVLFLFGAMDSLKLLRAYRFFTSPEFPEGPQIEAIYQTSFLYSIKQLFFLFILEGLKYLFSSQSGFASILLGIIFILQTYIYLDVNIRQLVYIDKITQRAIKIGQNVISYQDISQEERLLGLRFMIYEIAAQEKKGSSTFVVQLKNILMALLFSMLLLVQTSVLDILYMLYPSVPYLSKILKHLDFLFYSVYLTTGYYSLKLPYREHLPYFFHQYIGYMMGYSLFLSYILNMNFTYPFLGLIFSLVAPAYLLQAFYLDPPYIGDINEKSLTQSLQEVWGNFLGNVPVNRDSFKEHLKSFNQSQIYKKASLNTVGWFSLAKGVREYLINPFNQGFSLLLSIYSALAGER